MSYDPAKNITGFGDASAITARWKVAQGGRVSEAKGPNGERIELKYDIRNRVIERRVQQNGFRLKVWKYEWDAKDRLTATTTPEGERWTYGYDPFGRRIYKIDAQAAKAALRSQMSVLSEEEKNRGAYHEDEKRYDYPTKNGKIIVGTSYLWDGEVVAEEADMLADGSADWNNATKWHYHPESFVPLAKETATGELFYIVTDHLGTPREMFSEDGHLAWAALYRTWGGIKRIWKPDNDNDRPVLGTPPSGGRTGNLAIRYDTVEEQQAQDCPIRFQGQWEDAETGLYYNRYRYYDPLVGQYISPDPLGLEGGTRPQGYVDNPSAWIDPWGLAGDPAKATHNTYQGFDAVTGKPYVGYASMPGQQTGQDVLKYRYNGDFSRFGGQAPRIVYEGYGTEGKQIARGLEQLRFEELGGLKGTANKQNPVGENNPNKDIYSQKAKGWQASQVKGTGNGKKGR